VVEDDDAAAVLVRLLLEAEGFDVLRAASAEETLPTRGVSTRESAFLLWDGTSTGWGCRDFRGLARLSAGRLARLRLQGRTS
jgi:hypothetical protein